MIFGVVIGVVIVVVIHLSLLALYRRRVRRMQREAELIITNLSGDYYVVPEPRWYDPIGHILYFQAIKLRFVGAIGGGPDRVARAIPRDVRKVK